MAQAVCVIAYPPGSHVWMRPAPYSGCGLTLTLETGHLHTNTATHYQLFPGLLGERYANTTKQTVRLGERRERERERAANYHSPE